MCGIAGIYNVKGAPVDAGLLKGMALSLAHRGPDGFGYMLANIKASRYVAAGGDIRESAKLVEPDMALAHRRLSIIDLSSAGHQPMPNVDGTNWIVYNGEIYNYIEMRDELKRKGHLFRSNTDTEVILASYAEWGEGCLTRFNGMFAFALWDGARRVLFCARDRFGVKPFYYHFDGERFIFASEIKALTLEGGAPFAPNDGIICDYLSSGVLDHAEDTFFAGIKKLMPAHCMTVVGGGLRTRRWWDIKAGAQGGAPLPDREYAGRFYAIFEDSVRLRLRSDVPVGTCLSGGIDSSAVACVANRLMFAPSGESARSIIGKRQKTFSACFTEPRYDERRYIEEVLKETGAEGHSVFPDGNRLFDELPGIIRHQDEPFRTTSIFAQWNVMRLAKETGVKVLLDGQGADELFAGYHLFFEGYYRDLIRSHDFSRLIGEVMAYRRVHGTYPLPILAAMAGGVLPGWLKAAIKSIAGIDEKWIDPDFRNACSHRMPGSNAFSSSLDNQLYTHLMSHNLQSLLRYEDRNSMAFSIEARVPFLDYRLAEFAFALPAEQKIRAGATKVILRNAMEGVIPEAVRRRADKIGFETPEDKWFRTSAKDAVAAIIRSKGFRELPYFRFNWIEKEFEAHLSGRKNAGAVIWRWINLYLWLEAFKG